MKGGKSKTRKPRNFFLSFLFPNFRFWVLGENRKVGREKAGKNFPRLWSFPRFPSFRPGPMKMAKKHMQ